jgi:hypothetical protein
MKNMKRHMKNNKGAEEILNQAEGDARSLNPFMVPAGYFDELPGRILDKIAVDKRRPAGSWKGASIFVFRNAWISYLAAATIIIALILIIPWQRSSNKVLTEIHDTLNLNTDYDASYANDAALADYKVIEEYLGNPSNSNYKTLNFNIMDLEEIPDEAIIEYLNEQELDTELLAEL